MLATFLKPLFVGRVEFAMLDNKIRTIFKLSPPNSKNTLSPYYQLPLPIFLIVRFKLQTPNETGPKIENFQI